MRPNCQSRRGEGRDSRSADRAYTQDSRAIQEGYRTGCAGVYCGREGYSLTGRGWVRGGSKCYDNGRLSHYHLRRRRRNWAVG